MPRLLVIVCWLACSVALAGAIARPARAAAPEERVAAEARAEYQAGTKAYNLGQFDEAITSFTRAYELDAAPILLYNIGQAHWKKGDNEHALFFYRRYLEAAPHAADRAKVEARIQELEQALAARRPPPPVAAGAAGPPLPQAAPPPARADLTTTPMEPGERPLYQRPWFWAVIGAVAVGAVAATFAARSGGTDPWSCGDGCGLGTVPVR
jgi:tetratricopeptide (TPR) repeat protein